MKRLIAVILLAFSLWPANSYCQNDSSITATVHGIAFDSTHNYVLANATAAIYKSDSAALLRFQLTNNYGEFQFESVPSGIPIRIVLSYVGYKDVSIRLTLSKTDKIKNLGKINLMQKEGNLEEVQVIYTPPVRMNKDTLEFNADAFDIDKNAVVENLLKKLPGVTVWGDGSITVNGKEVKSLLVNGKPFLGGSTKIAIQNIPKDAVEKVQVYQQDQGASATRDSTTEVNIKLKADKSTGYFGKLAAGQGNVNRNEQHTGLNWFSPKTQSGIIASRNNTNRIAGNTTALLENNTFKGRSDMDYQPQFNLPGLNRIIEGGIIFQRDFIEKADYYNKNRLQADYFVNHNHKTIDQHSETITSLNKDEKITTNSSYASKNTFHKQQFDPKYERKKNSSSFSINSSFFLDRTSNEVSSSDVTYDGSNAIQSQSERRDNSTVNNNSFLLNSSYEQELKTGRTALQNKTLRLNYSARVNSFDENSTVNSRFNSLTIPSQSRITDRDYDNNKRYFENKIVASIANVGQLKLMGGKRVTVGIETGVANTTVDIDNKVYDRPAIGGIYKANTFLTNKATYENLSVTPSINLTNSISKKLSNRYDKGLTTTFNIREQLYYQKVNSNHIFQNSNTKYYQFIPELLFKYVNFHFGEFKDQYTIKIGQHAVFPNAEQLLLLADSSNIYQLREGNPGLRPSDIQDISLEMSHATLKSHNQFSYSVKMQIGRTENYIGDSSIIFKNGQTNYNYVNLPGHRFFTSGLNISKSYKIKTQTIQLMVSATSSIARIPGVLNAIFYYSKVHEMAGDVRIYYYPDSRWGIDAGLNYQSFSIHQQGFSYDLRNVSRSAYVNVNSDITSRLNLNSNISFVHNGFTGGRANYTIWNASAAYRFLEAKNAEIKFSVFDLLRENSNIGYRNTSTSLSTIYNNVLQQYFMLTLSYFPRKFGRGTGR